MTTFTPVASLAGGVLIGLSAVLLMAFTGRIAGVSGIAVRILPPFYDHELLGRLAFLAGLVVVPSIFFLLTGDWPRQSIEASGLLLIVSGILVGFGSVWGNGCTSGHGVCGISRLSTRSFVATIVFMTTGIVTAVITRHLL